MRQVAQNGPLFFLLRHVKKNAACPVATAPSAAYKLVGDGTSMQDLILS